MAKLYRLSHQRCGQLPGCSWNGTELSGMPYWRAKNPIRHLVLLGLPWRHRNSRPAKRHIVPEHRRGTCCPYNYHHCVCHLPQWRRQWFCNSWFQQPDCSKRSQRQSCFHRPGCKSTLDVGNRYLFRHELPWSRRSCLGCHSSRTGQRIPLLDGTV